MEPDSGNVQMVGFPDFDITPDLAQRVKQAFEIQDRERNPLPSVHDLLEAISDHPWVVRTVAATAGITEVKWQKSVKMARGGYDGNERDRGPITFDQILRTAAKVAEGDIVGTEEVFIACGYEMGSPFALEFRGEMFWSILRMERLRRGLDESNDP